MLRTFTLSTLLTGAPIIYFIQPRSVAAALSSALLALLIPIATILLVRWTRRRTQRRTIAMLARGGDTLDLIIAEAERRAGRKDTPPARSKT